MYESSKYLLSLIYPNLFIKLMTVSQWYKQGSCMDLDTQQQVQRFNVNLYAQSKSPIHVNAISNCFEPLQGLVNTWWGWTVSNFRVSVLLRKLLVGAKYHKNSKSNATTLAFILIEFPFIHPSKQKIIYDITWREYINVQSCISQSLSNSKRRLCSQTKF